MTPSRRDFDPEAGSESIGALLVRLRLASGRSQLRLAELLCAASGVPTLTRHEVSRWEREERIPSQRWLVWLAAVLEAPLDDLERAAALARARRDALPGPPLPDEVPPWRSMPANGDAVLAARDVTILAASVDTSVLATRVDTSVLATRVDTSVLATRVDTSVLAARVAALRRMDDLVGGADLSRLTERELAAALQVLRADGLTERQRRRLLPVVAELAQLACWVAADAGAPGRARRAHRIGVAAATAAEDCPLLGHLLTTLAHLGTPDGSDPLELARRGYRLGRSAASATVRALLLHRIAFAAARAGQRRACEESLAGAERAFERRDPARDPAWAYWFDDAELTAMAGRCYAAAGRPRLAEPLLRAALADRRIRLRAWALYAGWLAGVQLDTGEVDGACATARAALLETVRVGSVRAARQLTALHPRLRPLRAVPAVREYAELYRSAARYLPAAPGGAAGALAG
ncbi:helix-turn-helix transcriptional regulator [Planosporangium thailandense]|uniref:Helix-turn-helix transcriptional regulator n=1 Tax=Planosporangium thailandense TaxID=765197 RepID=A0ABX0XUQ8_9ACTN|nr:helix-turn-helix transcriptional regulator [Planosporangium thailandense]NJC69750.1 helix-turn-helix transcriptional regulator [Planosporangium thailandense]